MTAFDLRIPTELELHVDVQEPPLRRLPDEPGEVVCRSLLQREPVLELGVDDSHAPHEVYLVATRPCLRLSPVEARAAAAHLLRAASDAEVRDRGVGVR